MMIKAVSRNDAEQYLTLLHNAYQAASALGIHFAAATADLAQIEAHIAANIVYALQDNNHDNPTSRLVSTLTVRLPWGNNPGPYGLPHLGWFATDPNYAQQGLGGKLMTWVETHILKNSLKAPAVTLGTAENHPWLITMYEKQGFKPIGQADLGFGHTTIYLQKILDDTLYQHWKNHQPKCGSTITR